MVPAPMFACRHSTCAVHGSSPRNNCVHATCAIAFNGAKADRKEGLLVPDPRGHDLAHGALNEAHDKLRFADGSAGH